MGAIKESVISYKLKPQWPKNLLWSLSWRALPVFLVISLLMSMAVLVMPTPAMAENHEGEQTAEFLPSDAVVYLTVNLDPSEEQLAGFLSILNYWWQDPNVQAKWDELMEQVEDESDVNIADDILSWIGPELALGVRNFAVQEDMEPEIVVFIGTTDKTASDTFINNKFIPQVTDETGSSGFYGSESEIETLYFPGEGPYCAFTDEYIIVSSTQAFLEDTLDLMLDGGESLAGNDNFEQAQDALPDRVGMLYGNLESFLDELDQQIGLGVSDIAPTYFATSIKFEGTGMTGTGYYPVPEAITFPSTQSALLENARIVPGNALAVASMDENASWMAATTYLQALWGKLTEATTGPLSEVTGEIEGEWENNIAPVLEGLAGKSLVEAVDYLDTTFNLNLEAAWENIKADMGDLSGMTFAQALAYLNDDLGLGGIWSLGIAPLIGEMSSSESFEDAITTLFEAMPDLLLLSESTVAVLPPSSLDDEPDVLYITEVSDVLTVQGYLSVVIGILDSLTEAQVSTQMVGGVDATTIGDGESVAVGYMFLDVNGTDEEDVTHYLVVGSTVDSLESVVSVRDDSAKSLSETEEYIGLEYQLGGEDSIRGSFMYLNITSMLKIEALSSLEFGTPFDEQISQLFYYVPLKSALGFTNPILGDDGITMNAALFLLPPPLVDQQIDEDFLGALSIPEHSFDLSSVDPDLGQAGVKLDVDIISSAPAGASIQIAVMTDPSADILSSFDLAASDDGFSIDGIAYVIVVDKVNITSNEIGESTVTLKVGKAWADDHGVDNIMIIRIGDDGTKEVLSTEFIKYEGDQAVFEGVSENGLSYFGLAAVSEGGSGGTNWGLIGGIIGGVVVVLAIATIILLRRRSQPVSLS